MKRVTEMSVLGFVMACVAACGGTATDPASSRTVDLELVGTVTAALDSQPVAGALVELGWGGHFSLPQVRQTTQTDVSGEFQLSDSLTYSGDCPFLWLRVEADGYEVTSIEDSRLSVDCRSSTQQIDVALERADS